MNKEREAILYNGIIENLPEPIPADNKTRIARYCVNMYKAIVDDKEEDSISLADLYAASTVLKSTTRVNLEKEDPQLSSMFVNAFKYWD